MLYLPICRHDESEIWASCHVYVLLCPKGTSPLTLQDSIMVADNTYHRLVRHLMALLSVVALSMSVIGLFLKQTPARRPCPSTPLTSTRCRSRSRKLISHSSSNLLILLVPCATLYFSPSIHKCLGFPNHMGLLLVSCPHMA